MPTWAQVLLHVFARSLEEQGRAEQAALITDAVAAVKAGKNVDTTMQAYADAWSAAGAPPSVESIAEARKEIQAAIG